MESERVPTTVMIEYRGLRLACVCACDADDPMSYEHRSIKPEGDNADFLAYLQGAGEWAIIDRLIDHQMQEFIALREAGDTDLQMAEDEEHNGARARDGV